ncbi:hypothetical protein [Oryzomonas rubra]|uniref:Uncharacterized protein n=1 Tax=Oryzomonas rubra TaxID=2509454 RepID=A0A5A9X6L4_9BACT|nr:hypothetical protein [Oryzomonas rubra]KAA0888088.1 hypothetical protein ET418_16950 [Oryzomonas rubra]
MKVIIIIIIAVIMSASAAFAGAISSQMTFTINGYPITLTKNADMSFRLGSDGSTLTHSDTESGWVTASPVQILMTSGYGYLMTLMWDNSVVLTNSASPYGTATVTLVCRWAAGGTYPASKTAGSDCSTLTPTSSTTAIALFPTSVTFDSNNQTGAYTGTTQINANYY